MNTVRCEDCAYWQRPHRREGAQEDDARTGQCRRNPPFVILSMNGPRAVWPITFRDHWCGEHAVEG